MFYSHEILTSRKYGVATVWLVATLGSRSTLKKVNRKQILDVNVSKACETIIAPEAPMALRLQGNLLYGVSRVFSQQCGYILADAQNMQNKIRSLVHVVSGASLDEEAGRTRPEQLLLEDDPSFVPDFALGAFDLNLADLGLPFESPKHGQLSTSDELSPFTSNPSRSSGNTPLGGIIIPSSETGRATNIGGFNLPGADDTRVGGSAFGGDLRDDDGFLPDADFSFDAEGNLLELTRDRGSRQPSMTGSGRLLMEESDEQAQQQQTGLMDIEPQQPVLEDEGPLPDAPGSQQLNEGVFQESIYEPDLQEDTTLSTQLPTAAAQRRAHRNHRIIPLDQHTTLHNSDLAQWSASYRDRMAAANEQIIRTKQITQARKNAEFWILRSGLGGVGAGQNNRVPNALAATFAGDGLWDMLTRMNPGLVGSRAKRSQPQDEGRRVRQRTSSRSPEAEERRGNAIADIPSDAIMMDDGGPVGGHEEDVELGRHLDTPLADPSHASLPWNIASSLARGARSHSTTTDIRSRVSRLVSQSPLVGRSSAIPDLENLPQPSLLSGAGLTSDWDVGDFGGAEGVADTMDYERYGPAAMVDTQTAAAPGWVESALDIEGWNFLDFVRAATAGQKEQLQAEAEAENIDLGEEDQEAANWIGLEDLLPPPRNSKTVAAQAFLHVLTLATRNLLEVTQEPSEEDVGVEVRMRIIETAEMGQ